MSDRLGGAWAAALTPLKDDLSIDLDAMVAHHRWLLAQGCDGVAVLGTTGEANSFSVPERRAAIEKAAQAKLPSDKVMIGTGCCALPDTVELTKAALAAGFPNVLMLPPFYYKVGDEGVVASYSALIERVADPRLRIYVYDFPKMTGIEISPALLERLHKQFPQTIVGVKDSSGDWAAMEETCKRLPGFGMFSGTEQYLLASLRAGGVGCISATANATARLCGQLYAAWRGPEADRLQAELTEVRLMLQAYPAVASLKEIMARHTGRPQWRRLRPPLTNLPAGKAEELFAAMDGRGFGLADAA